MDLRILVVDDDILTRREIKQMLTHAGHYVENVESGVKAISRLKENRFDLVFLDLKMPNMDGIDVLKVILTKKPKIHVIMITAYATIETAVEAMKLGAYDYIKKPFQPKQLHVLVNKVIDEIKFERGFRNIEGKGKQQDGYEIFSDRLEEGDKGLCISKKSPQEVLEEFDKKKRMALQDSIFWLTTSRDDGLAVHPHEIEDLEEIFNDFIAKGGGVILFDGIEILIEFNSWDTVKELFIRLTEKVSTTTSHLIISVDSSEIGENELWELKNLFRSTYGDYVFDSLANSIRRDIIRFLSIAKKATFTTILRGVNGGDSPKFTFHLKRLLGNDIIEKDTDGKYSLTMRGERLFEIFSHIDRDSSDDTERRISLVFGIE